MKTEVWMQDRKQFIPKWAGEWTPAPEMLDFEEKWEAFHTPGGRLMTCAHRGDVNIYYPENSLEGFYSAILAGADILEVDVHTTKDKQLIIMHDDALTRTTNVSSLRAEGADWLPETDEIHDWTLEQIRRLRLITKQKELTEYAVPTLRELIALAKNRVFITLDKWWDFSWDESVYPLIEELKAYRTVLIPFGYPLELAYEIQRKMFRATGISAPFYAMAAQTGGVMAPDLIKEAVAFLAEHQMPPVLRGGEFKPEEKEMLAPIVDPLKGNHRFYAETLRAVHDNPDHWQQMVDIGYNIIMGNRIYELLAFTKARYFM